MSKTNRYLVLAVFLCVFTVANNGFAYEDQLFIQESIIEEDERGMSYHFVGDAEKEGALKLFVKNAASDYDVDDPIDGSGLNSIEPAAGVKLQFDF